MIFDTKNRYHKKNLYQNLTMIRQKNLQPKPGTWNPWYVKRFYNITKWGLYQNGELLHTWNLNNVTQDDKMA